jgi:predicted RecB family nuclease
MMTAKVYIHQPYYHYMQEDKTKKIQVLGFSPNE